MTSASSAKLRVNIAEQFKESVSEIANTKLYLTYGKVSSWDNDSSPPTPNTSMATEYEVWHNMIGGKKILGSDISHVIPRFNWSANTVYVAYDHMNGNLFDGNTKFYMINKNYDVYKCLANNSGANSTVEPVAISTSVPVETSDGYVWKYMYTVSESDQLRFMTNSYIPVKTQATDDGSLQWSVQQNSTDGAILATLISSGGSGYSNTSNVIVTITGDGTSATATANINTVSKTVSTIQMTDYGSGYTFATATITGGGGTGATARPIIGPVGGHGSDALYELGAAYLMLNPQIRGTESNTILATNEFRQISLIKDPFTIGTTNIFSNAVFTQGYTFKMTGTGDYTADEFVYTGASLAASTFSGQILNWDSTTGTATVINTTGTPQALSMTGATSYTTRFINEIKTGELANYTGHMLYIDNISPVSRASDQIDDFKILLRF